MLKIALALLLLLPATAFGAGFAKQSLFLSKSPVIEGDTVLVHAVVQNDSATEFSGEVVFWSQQGSNAKEKIGSAAASIAAQGAQAVSVSWKPLAGDYAVTASLTGKDGSVVEEETGHFTINPKPKPASSQVADITDAASSSVGSSAEVEAMVDKFVPLISNAAHPVFLAIDSLRFKAGDLLDQGINWSKSKVGTQSPAKVLGESTTKENTIPQGVMSTVTYFAALIGLYVFSVLKWFVANAGVFYPVLALLFLFGIWKLLLRIRRPSY